MDSLAKGSNHVPFSVNGFYSCSRKRKRVGHKLEIKSQQYAHEFMPKKFSQRLFGPSDTWKVFFKQADAFAFVHKTRLNLHVFAFESESNKTDQQGMRMYLAATYPVFWHYYSQLDEAHRHHYEIIPEGSVCKLYFDLEFYREFNPTLEDGYDLCRTFIKYVCAWLKEIFSLDCDERHVLILDASTATKYSEHLIFLLPNAAFKDNYQVGSFVQFISTRLVMWLKETMDDEENKNHGAFNNVGDPLSAKGTEMVGEADIATSSHKENDTKISLESSTELANGTLQKYQAEKIFSLFSKEMLQKLIVKDKNDDEILLCDLGVYTKNRNFRLFLSRKLGQKNPFLVSHHNKFIPASKEDETMFFESLIANVENGTDLKILIFEQKTQVRLRMRNLQIKSPDFSVQGGGDSSELSPYPEVDTFINSLVGSNGRRGKIRHWFYFMEGNLLGYDIAGYRWCGNINREHKSNNIRLFVDLKKCVYYQKCHDPVCKQANFCSDYYDLPPHVLPWLTELSTTETNEDVMYDELDDDSLADAVESIEQSRQCLELDDDEDDDDDLLISAVDSQ